MFVVILVSIVVGFLFGVGFVIDYQVQPLVRDLERTTDRLKKSNESIYLAVSAIEQAKKRIRVLEYENEFLKNPELLEKWEEQHSGHSPS